MDKTKNRIDWTTERAKSWCEEQGIEFLDDTYRGVKEKYHFKCTCGNTFERRFSDVNKGHIHCLDCSTHLNSKTPNGE